MLGEPVEHRLVGLSRSVGVVPRAGVVEEGVIDTGEDLDLVNQAGGFEGSWRAVSCEAFTRASFSA